MLFESHPISAWNVRLWLNRRRERPSSLLRCEILGDARHYLRNAHRDTKRRGRSNREGWKNRRWRRWKASQPKVGYTFDPFALAASVLGDEADELMEGFL